MAIAAPLVAFVSTLGLIMLYLGSWYGNPDIISPARIAQLQNGGTADSLDQTLALDATRVATQFVGWSYYVLAVALILALAWNVLALAGERSVAGPASQTRSLGLWWGLLFAYAVIVPVLWYILIFPHDLGILVDVPRQVRGAAPTFLAGLFIYWAGTAFGATRVMKPSVPFASALV